MVRQSLEATAPFENELAELEQAIRTAKETLRESKMKAQEQDTSLKRLVQTFVEQTASS